MTPPNAQSSGGAKALRRIGKIIAVVVGLISFACLLAFVYVVYLFVRPPNDGSRTSEASENLRCPTEQIRLDDAGFAHGCGRSCKFVDAGTSSTSYWNGLGCDTLVAPPK